MSEETFGFRIVKYNKKLENKKQFKRKNGLGSGEKIKFDEFK